MKYISTLKILSVFTIPALISSCAHKHEQSAHEEGEGHDHHDEIMMSVEDAARFGVAVEAVESQPFAEVVKVFGEILPASADQSVVSAPTAGVVKLSRCTELGEKVSAGHVIATVSAKGVTGGDANVSAKAAMDAAKRELDRLEPLLKEGIVTKKDYNDALSAYELARSAYSPSAASGRAVAGISGIISALMVNDGAYVEAGQPIASISSSSRLTLKALLPARDAAFLPQIVSAAVKSSNDGGIIELAERNGKLLSTSASAASTAPGYIPVFFSFDNHGDLVPGTPAEIFLESSGKTDALTLPVSALSEQQGEMFVYVRVDDHAYRKQPVAVGRSNGKRVEILSGVNAGDSVVTEGSTFIRLAETSTVVPEGHSHNH